MNIPIYQEPKELSQFGKERCIFCNHETIYWTIDPEINRPVCPLCSVVNNLSDIAKAPYNY